MRITESFRQWEKTTGSDNVSWQIGKEDKGQLVQPILTKEVSIKGEGLKEPNNFWGLVWDYWDHVILI